MKQQSEHSKRRIVLSGLNNDLYQAEKEDLKWLPKIHEALKEIRLNVYDATIDDRPIPVESVRSKKPS